MIFKGESASGEIFCFCGATMVGSIRRNENTFYWFFFALSDVPFNKSALEAIGIKIKWLNHTYKARKVVE